MADASSARSAFKIKDTGGALRDLSDFVDDIDGLPGPRKLTEVTGLGANGTAYVTSLEDTTFTIKGATDDTATTGPDAVLGPLRTHSAAVDFEAGPFGDATGQVKYSGKCWILSYTYRAKGTDPVRFAAKAQVEGQVTRGAF